MTAATVYNSGVDGIMALVLFQILMVVAMAAVAVADKPFASTRVSVCTLLTHTHTTCPYQKKPQVKTLHIV